jgi:hypothetical protein
MANKEVASMPTATATVPNPRRVAAGRLNQLKRKGLTSAGRARLRLAALQNQPWRFSTGPRTAAGKAKVAQNGKRSQRGPLSVHQIRIELAKLRSLAKEMEEGRSLASRVM